jgi:hypothetical protein
MKFDSLYSVAVDSFRHDPYQHPVHNRPGWQRQTLLVGSSVRAIFLEIAANARHYLPLAIPLVACAALTLAVNKAIVAGWDPYGAIELSKQIVDLLVTAMFVNSTIRLSVHGPTVLRNRFGLGWGRPETRLLWRSFLVMVPCIAAFAPFIIVPVVGWIVGSIAAILLWARLSTYWASGALDRPLDLLAAWETTRGNGFAIFLAMLLTNTPFVIVIVALAMMSFDLLVVLLYGHAAAPPFNLAWHAAVTAFEIAWLMVTTVLAGLICKTLTPSDWIKPPEKSQPPSMSTQEAIAASVARLRQTE